MKKYFIYILLYFTALPLFAQKEAQTSALIKVKLLKGLNITKIKGNLDFGEVILNGDGQKIIKQPDEGIEFVVSGHPNKEAIITYKPTLLTQSSNHGSNPLIFLPAVLQTGVNINFVSPSVVKSGSTILLNNQNGIGKTFIWVGGDIDIKPQSTEGNYEGIFTLTVAY